MISFNAIGVFLNFVSKKALRFFYWSDFTFKKNIFLVKF